MPELPEVETVMRELRPLLVGRTVCSVRKSRFALRRPWKKAWEPLLIGKPIDSLARRGKWIQVHLSEGTVLILHLGMTGQLTVHPEAEPIADHVHLRFGLDDGDEELRFRDIRRFGSATVHPSAAAWEASLDERLGPEPFDLSASAWWVALQKTDRILKAILLDQSILAGVGNIYADESLFQAKLHPTRTGRSVTKKEAECLREAIVEILTNAIDSRGSTIRNYVGGSGLSGGFQDSFCVYGRTGEPCVHCKQPIEVLRLAGRSSHFCPVCQPASKAR